MINEVLGYRVENRVAWVTIQREEARNALSKAVREGLWAGVRRFNDDDTALVFNTPGMYRAWRDAQGGLHTAIYAADDRVHAG